MTALFKPVAKTPAKTSSYSRFIPREEIDEVVNWHFSSMDSNLAPVQAHEADGPTQPSADAGADPQDEPVQPSAAESIDLQAEREQAWADGFAQGRQQGEQETRAVMTEPLQQALQANALRMAELLHNMADQLLTHEQKISHQLLELACDIARQVVRQELTVNTHQLRTVIGEALEMVVDDGLPATVRMNPNDLALMKASLIETLGENAPEFAADATITPGGCLIHTPSMAVDATVEKRWARAVGNLGLSVPWKSDGKSDEKSDALSPVSPPDKTDPAEANNV